MVLLVPNPNLLPHHVGELLVDIEGHCIDPEEEGLKRKY